GYQAPDWKYVPSGNVNLPTRRGNIETLFVAGGQDYRGPSRWRAYAAAGESGAKWAFASGPTSCDRRVEPKEAPVVKATNDTFDPKSFLPKVGEGKTILRFKNLG
ncbi:MAG: hypothetical protein WAM50_08980, partial [Pseudolabrys sp.]